MMASYHLVGVRGVAMAGLARILKERGAEVSGCDLVEEGHSADHVTKNLSGLVISAAVTPDSPGAVEVEAAKRLGVPVIERLAMVDRLARAKTLIAISGMHGKTTVAAMLAHIFSQARRHPSWLYGAPGAHAAFWDKGREFIVEACEWERQFLALHPALAVVTNIEPEHLDTYRGGIAEITETFAQFVQTLPKDGLLVGLGDDREVRKIARKVRCPAIFYGFERGVDYRATSLSLTPTATRFVIRQKGRAFGGHLALRIPGRHNIANALAALAVSDHLRIPRKTSLAALASFRGVLRRFEIKGERGGILVIDDYGHHPTELRATLAAARQWYPNRRLIVLFQPHQHARTRMLLARFARAFGDADLVFVTEIYGVPGRDSDRFPTEKLVAAIARHHPDVRYCATYHDCERALRAELASGDLLLTVGATRIFEVGERILSGLQ